MRAFVKYCGGCNPTFDRAGFVKRLKEELTGIEWARDAQGVDYALIVCGCRRECASQDGIGARLEKIMVSDEADFALTKERLTSF